MLPDLIIARSAMTPRKPDYSRIGAVYRIFSQLRNRGLSGILDRAILLAPKVKRRVPSRVKTADGVHWLH